MWSSRGLMVICAFRERIPYIKWRKIYVTRWVRDELYFSLVWVSDSSMLREFLCTILHFAPNAHGTFC